MKSVARQPPSQGRIRDASRPAQTSSQPGIRQAACVDARWAEPGPTWVQADRDPTPSGAFRGYSGLPNPEQSFADGFRGRGSRSPDTRDEGCRPVARIRSSPSGLVPVSAEPVLPDW